jgi:predicted membrane protein
MVVVWIVAMLFWNMIQFSPDSNGEGITEYIDLIVIIIVGVLFGINFLVMNWIFNSQKASLDRLSYGGE